MTDFLPTICEAADVAVPKTLPIDSGSFLSQVRDEKGQPRDWLYSFRVPLRASQTGNVGSRGAVEQAFDRHFKLYSTGKFFDLDRDVAENSPQRVADLHGAAAAAAHKLQAALDQFKDARPASLNPPHVPGERKRKNK